MNILSDFKIESGTADFRLIDKTVLNEIINHKEMDLFYRGMISYLGFKQCLIEYESDSRKYGETKYTVKKMLKLAITGVTSFSDKPLVLSLYLGSLITFISLLYFIYIFIAKFFFNTAVDGWASILGTIIFIGGTQLIVMGVMGIYLGKIFFEVKNRPHYFIDELKLKYEV